MKDVVMVFTSKSLQTMREEGGSGNWAANKDRLRHAKWIVATRNQNSGWTQGDEGHKHAFLIGRVSGIKPAPVPEQNRFVIVFDQFAELNIPNAWTGSRNPVAYTDLKTLNIDVDKLEWKPFVSGVQQHAPTGDIDASNVVDRARWMIAQALSVSPDAVKITVAL
jgi:hypothetical protein